MKMGLWGKSFGVWVELMIVVATYFPIITIFYTMSVYWWVIFALILSALVIYFAFRKEKLSLKTWLLIILFWIVLTAVLYLLMGYVLPTCDGCAVPLGF